MKGPRQPSRFRELVSSGVIDRRDLPHPLSREQSRRIAQRLEELHRKATEADSSGIDF